MTQPAPSTSPGTPTSPETPSSRDIILARIRAALSDVPRTPGPPDTSGIPRDYLQAHVPDDDPTALTDLLAAHLTDYRAHVHRTTTGRLPQVLAELLATRRTRTTVIPPELPREWLARTTGITHTTDHPHLTATQLDGIDTVITGCALAIAETGTLVLDAGPDQGRRILTLVPDHHVCVVRAPQQIVASVPRALPHLDPTRPLTWISGPSATSDIELSRVEGVHGPRTLDVILVSA
ncbi:hypothetical protein RVR_699 [Actinacidiphila reveromycinica]|uniref:LUD domain-containing protein n=1 Tax=Actinacidiphila reveromycinica TaxID=659352 RepID=A0A7U3UN97_9ACTN|nr:lactate utilization protein C [Streptomyces sp. SN-593]BBA95721.1 hypothetical protein RVR_699 [Streptomyces sp. SN-593]